MSKYIRTVMVFGTFDGVHEGHKFLFRQAAEYGNHIIAVVARDITVEKVKGHRPKNDENKRLFEVLQTGLIDDSILGYGGKDKCAIVRDNMPNVVLLGYDQEAFTEDLHALTNEGEGELVIVRAEPYKPEIYKSSLLNR